MLSPFTRSGLAAGIGLALLINSGEARADWYGAPIIATDTAGWLLTVGGGVTHARPAALTGIAVIMVGGPIVHAARGNYGRMGISAGLRLGGALVGFAAGGKDDGGGGPPIISGSRSLLGAVVGIAVAQIFDIAVLARDERDPEAQTRMLSIGGSF